MNAAVIVIGLAVLAWLWLLLQAIEPLVWRALRGGPVRLGWVKFSAAAAWLCRGQFEVDPRGGRALAGALALVSRRAHDEALATWLEGQLGERGKLGAAGVAAAGLIAASRGQRDAARDLMQGAAHWEHAAPAIARVVAGEWLVIDAAERGDWRTVMRLGVRDGIASPTTRFLAFAAARVRREALIGEPSATDVGLRWMWWRSSGRAGLRPLLTQALATPRVLYQRKPPPPPPAEPSPPVLDPAAYAGDPVAHAQALHALWSTTPELERQWTPTRAAELCKAWDAAFAGPVLERLRERARVLASVTRPEVAEAQLRHTVGEELAALAARAQLPLAALQDCGGVGAEAALRLRGELILGVEKLSQALRARTKDKRALSSVDELREWNGLKRAYERAATVGGLEVRRVMFPDVHLNVCNYAVWLWNDRKEYGISGPLFRWLLAEAEAVGDEEAIALQKKNVGK
ncbi:MAG: hypothetical protein JNL82_10765 [Myxococcales bacterium]|nr:hypothetical protein [Myxococcales bacterium]